MTHVGLDFRLSEKVSDQRITNPRPAQTLCSPNQYWYVNKARVENYKNFYKNYDAEADFQRMKVGCR